MNTANNGVTREGGMEILAKTLSERGFTEQEVNLIIGYAPRDWVEWANKWFVATDHRKPWAPSIETITIGVDTSHTVTLNGQVTNTLTIDASEMHKFKGTDN